MGCGTSSPSAAVETEAVVKQKAAPTPAPAPAPVPSPAAAAPAAAPAAVAEEPLIVPAIDGSIPEDSTIIFVLGGPGCGKGTQCDKIKATYEGVVHLSAGDLLRAEVASGSEVGAKCEALMKEGKLVPMTVTISLLKNAMISSGGSFFLIDGFPRKLDQGQAFEESIIKCKHVLFFDCPEDEMRKRLLKRGETSGRSDDNEATIIKRFQTFVNESMPVKDYYLEQGKCSSISAVQTPDEVFAEVRKVLDPVAPFGAISTEAAEDEFVVPAIAGEVDPNASIVFVLGGPGCGKGTQCDKIKATYKGVVHLSAGDLLRAEVASGSEVGAKCEALMKEGKIVPMEVTMILLKNAMISSGGSFFLIDGFPRKLDQGQAFEASIKECKLALFFDCPEDEMRKRLLHRGETSGRSDDNEATIIKRFQTFVTESLPVKYHFESLGKAAVISAIATPDEVFAEVRKVLDPIAPYGFIEEAGEVEEVGEAEEAGEVETAEEPLVVPAVDGSIPEDSTIIFVLGGPGCGKGTQCDKIKATYEGVVHLSAGDLLRAEVASGSEVGAKCEALMKEGKIVPLEVTMTLLKNAMISSGGSFFLIDGFPRKLDQGQAFEETIMPSKGVLFFDCPEDEMRKRLLHRGETSGRSDDNEATIMKRFQTFVTESLPVKDYYQEQGKCSVVSAVPPPDEVFEEVRKFLDPLVPGGAAPAEPADEAEADPADEVEAEVEADPADEVEADPADKVEAKAAE